MKPCEISSHNAHHIVNQMVSVTPTDYAKSLPGTGPFGFFDPLGFCAGDVSEGKIRFSYDIMGDDIMCVWSHVSETLNPKP